VAGNKTDAAAVELLEILKNTRPKSGLSKVFVVSRPVIGPAVRKGLKSLLPGDAMPTKAFDPIDAKMLNHDTVGDDHSTSTGKPPAAWPNK
jgi:hypothetical protein